MNTEITASNLIENFTNELNQRAEALAAQLKTMDEEHASKRSGLVTEIASVQNALARLTGKAPQKEGSTGSRKFVMSEVGKENIRKALLARRERLAAEKAGTPAAGAPAPSAATSEQEPVTEKVVAQAAEPVGTPEPAPAKKGGKKSARK